MTINLGSVHQPLNDFFLGRFRTEEGSRIVFRFDKFGSVVSEQDFVDPHGGGRFSADLAREKVSFLVNRIPVEAGDGLHVLLSADPVDSTYFDRLLSPAQPFVPGPVDDTVRESVVTTFSRIKAAALRAWDQVSLASLQGLPLDFKPSEATPANWYDPAGQDAWTSTSFTVSDTDRDPGPEVRLAWKLKPTDQLLSRALDLPAEPDPVVRDAPAADVAKRVLALQLDGRGGAGLGGRAPAGGTGLGAVRGTAPRSAAARTGPSRLVEDLLGRQAPRLDIRRRLAIHDYIDAIAPVEDVGTGELTISFEYCLVHVQRAWLSSSFLNGSDWWTPNVPKGDLTVPGRPGALSMLPVGFLAVRNLRITGNWSDADRQNMGAAMSFGPFKVAADSADGEISHSGLQLIGWMLQLLPPLPPNAPPETAPGPAAAPRTYTVQPGDTLWSIAVRTYGDGTRWGEILRANGLAAPEDLRTGQSIVLP